VRIAIHQPNFLPWLPFFRKIEAVDQFVILTHCQYSKGGYQNRFQLNDVWHTMAVNSGLRTIQEKLYLHPIHDWMEIRRLLPEFATQLRCFDPCIGGSLVATNTWIIRVACEFFGIKTPISFDWPTELHSTDRLVDICRKLGATTYVSGQSGRNYLDLEKFGDIKVEFQEIEAVDRISLPEAMRAHYSE